VKYKIKIVITAAEFFKIDNKKREKTFRPDKKSKNLYSPIFRSIPGVKKNINKEIKEPKTYIKPTFFSPENIERKLELIKEVNAICKDAKKPRTKIIFNFEFSLNIFCIFYTLKMTGMTNGLLAVF
jgi:hypothetical protein